MSQEIKEKKPWYKKWWIWLVVAIVVIGAVAAGGGESGTTKTPSSTVEVAVEETPESELDGIKFTVSKVNDDVTGNWRISTIAEPIVISDLAVDYYKQYFDNDNEIHAIVNFNNNTTTQISTLGAIDPDVIDVTTYEYVKGEEHDAKKLFSGQKLTEHFYNVKTGEEVPLD